MTAFTYTCTLIKAACPQPHYLSMLKKFRPVPKILNVSCTRTMESILTGSIITWYGNRTGQGSTAPRGAMGPPQAGRPPTGSSAGTGSERNNRSCPPHRSIYVRLPAHFQLHILFNSWYCSIVFVFFAVILSLLAFLLLSYSHFIPIYSYFVKQFWFFHLYCVFC